MTKFSKDLVQRTVHYFAKKYDHHIDEETANEYLRSFAGLFMAFVDEPKPETKEENQT